MKRAIIIILMLTAAASFSFADEGEQAAAQEAPRKVIKEVTLKTGTSDFVTGKVNCVLPADLLTRVRSKIVVVDGTGNPNEFVIKALAVIYDSTGRFLSLNDIKEGQEVQVNYIKKSDNTNEAVAIRILK